MGAGTLKRSASYGPSTSTSKALTKPVAGGKGAAGGALAKAKTTVGSGAGAGALKPYTTFVKDSDKENEPRKRKPKKKAVASDTEMDSKPSYVKANTQRPTGLGRTQSFPQKDSGTKKINYTPPKTKMVDGVKKTAISAASKPQPKKAYTPYKPSETGLAGKNTGGGHIPLPGGFGESNGDSGSTKGYKPYKPPAGNTDSKKSGGGHIPLPGGLGDKAEKNSGGSQGYKPYTPSNKAGQGGGQANGEKKIDRTFF